MQFHTYAVLIEKPARHELKGLSHSAKYQYLRAYSGTAKKRLLTWLDAQNLANQVESVEPETAFNTLFFRATEAVREALSKNSLVVSVTEDESIHVEELSGPLTQ